MNGDAKQMKDLNDKKFKTKENGWPAREICRNRQHPTCQNIFLVKQPDGTELILAYTVDLKHIDGDGSMDLIQDRPWENCKIDDRVVCWDDPEDVSEGIPAKVSYEHFAGVSHSGRPITFMAGKSVHTSREVHRRVWDNCVSLEEWQQMQENKANNTGE